MSTKTVQTIEDIARLANVSKSTVSRALNNSPLLRQETKDRIQAIAREHNFHMHAPARSLSMRQSRTIAFVTHVYHMESCLGEDLFGMELMNGIVNGLHSLGYDTLIINVNPRETSWVNQYLDSGRVDGFVLMTSCRKQAYIKTMVDAQAPFIIWGVPATKYHVCSVAGDNFEGGRLAAEHLLRLGRQRVAFIGGSDYELEVQHRYQGYESALAAAGLGVDEKRVVYGDYSHESGITCMKELLEKDPDLDAVFVCSDLMAIGAIDVIQKSGKRVPEDIAVVGYDDISLAYFNNLPLTTIRQNIQLAGKLLAENLIQYIQTGVITNVTLPVELVVRKSA